MPEEIENPENDSTETDDSTDTEERTYSAAEMRAVRDEAAARRTALREAEAERDALRTRYQSLAVTHAAGDALSDASVLPWSDEWLTAEGDADLEAITEAADSYASANPHAARVRGDIGSGFRSHEDASVDLAGLMRASA